MYCFFDTETSGIPIDSLQINDAKQARILELACILTDENFETVNTFCSLIKFPEYAEINEGAFKAHGITKEKANKFGIPIEAAIIVLDSFVIKSSHQIGHNISFDLKMVHLEEQRIFNNARMIFPHDVCTMKEFTDICRLPAQSNRHGKYKWPKLEEAFKFAYPTEQMLNGHSALGDVLTTIKIFKWLVDNKFYKIV